MSIGPIFLAQTAQTKGLIPSGQPSFAPPSPSSTDGVVQSQQAHEQVPQAGPDPQAGSPTVTLLMMLGLFVFFYFIAIRPQQKQQKEHKEFVSSLKERDEVVTNSGILGKIVQLDDEVVRLEVDKNTRIRVLREHVSRRLELKTSGKRKS